MKTMKKIISLFAALCMTVSLIPQTLASAAVTDYQDAYSAISGDDYSAYNEEYYTSGINLNSNGVDGFVCDKDAWVSYNVDFGEKSADTMIMNMRPDVRNGHGVFGVYIDSIDSEPIIAFDESANVPYAGYTTYAGSNFRDYCFNIAKPLTGKHTVYFKAISDELATSFFNSFYFLDSSSNVTEPYSERISPSASTKVWGDYQSVKEEADGDETLTVLPLVRGAAYFTGIDFGNDGTKGGAGVTVRYNRWNTTSYYGEGSYEVRLDSIDGPVIGTLENSSVTTGFNTYDIQFSTLLTGVHTLVFTAPFNTTIGWIQFKEGTEDDLVIPDDSLHSAYEKYDVNLGSAFADSSTKYSFDVDFGESVPEYLALSMRPALEDAADGGVINVYIDDETTEPIASFTAYRDEVNLTSGNTVPNEWFVPVSMPEGFGGEHKVIFKSQSNAKSAFNYFRFDKDTAVKDAYKSITASTYNYAVHGGNTMWGGGGGAPQPYVVGFGAEGQKYFSAAYTKVDFGDMASDTLTVRLNKLSSNEGSVQVRLGSRYGEVIGTLDSDDITLGTSYSNAVEFYTISLDKTLTDVQDIVFTSDIDTTFYSFYFTGKEKPAEATDEDVTYVFDDSAVTSADGGAHSARTDGTYTGTHTKTDGAAYQLKLEDVDFGDTKSTYALELVARTLSKDDETNVLEFYIDSTETEPIGKFYAKDGVHTANICEYPVEISGGVSGIHDVYINWTGQWILYNFTCIKGTTAVFGTDPDGVIYAATSPIRSSTDSGIQSNGTLDNGYTVSGIGKSGLVNSVSFPGLDFGTEGVEKITLRMARVGDDTGTVKVLLGDRNGTELVSKPLSEVTKGTFQSYEFPISDEITGIHMITVTIDYESILNYVAFNLEGEPVVVDPATALDGHQAVSVLDCTSVDGGTFTSSTSGGNISVYAPVYTTGMSEGETINFNLSVENAKYVAVCAKSNNTQAAPVVGINKGSTEIASITVPQAYRNGVGYYMDVYTAELANEISGTASYSVVMKSGAANVAWVQFMTEEQYSAFTNSRTKVALLGDSNVEYGKYTIALREALDVNEYDLKSLGFSGKTVRNYKEQTQYQEALDYAPDIAVFTLGTNDAAQSCNDSYMESFKSDYTSMIEALRTANPNVKIYMQYPLPFQSDEPSDYTSYSNDNLVNKIIPAITEVASENNAEIIDIYNGVLNYGYERELLFSDGLHVNAAGGTIMAKLTKSAIAPNGGEITPADGDASEISVSVDTNILTKRGAEARATSDSDVYWTVENLDGTSTDKAEIASDGTVTAVKAGTYNVVAVSKANTSVKAYVRMENRFTYVISEDADLICSDSYSYRSLQTFRKPFVSGYADGTVIMLKDVMLDDVSAFTVRASSMYDTSVKPLKVECRLDSVNGKVIGSTIITKNSKDAKYAFMPYKNAIDPVCDGQPHNLFFVLNRGTDTNNTTRTIDGLYGIEFEYGSAKNLAVYEDGVLQDTMPIVNSDYDTTQKFTGYKAGSTYTWKSTTGNNADGELIMALYDADGGLKKVSFATKSEGVFSAQMTLPDDFDSTYEIKSIALESMANMKPVLKNPDVQTTDKITVGCIGDSITNNYNYDTEGYQEYCYPKFLQAMLGEENYEVMNFGRGTSTASSYKSNPWFERAKAAACDVYIIMLGTNDSKSSDYYNAISEDYQAIIDGLKEANPDCTIYINLPIAAYTENFGITDTVIENEVIPRVKAVAVQNGIEPLDLHTLTEENENFDAMYFSDGIHPNEFGQSFIAECVKNAYFAD